MKVKIEQHQVDALVAKALKESYKNFSGGLDIPFFSNDPYEEAKERKKLKDGFKQVYWYFTGNKLK